MKKGTKGGKLGTALRQGYQGLTLGFGDEAIDATGAAIAAILTGENYGDLYKDARSLTSEDFSRDLQNAPKTSFASNVAGSIIPGAAAGAKTLAQVGLGAASGFGSNNGDLKDRASSAALGGAFGLGGQYLAKGANRIAKGASDKIAPAVKETAKKLKEMGIPVRLSQLMDSKFLSAVDTAISKVPFSGASKSQAAQRAAFTRELSKSFGENADTITPEVLEGAKTRLGSSYDKLLGDKDIPIDRKAFAQQISQLVDDLSLENDEAGAAFVKKQAENILGTIDNNSGKLTGKSYQKLRQTLKGAKKNNYSVGSIQKFLDDSVRQNVPDNIASELGGIDEQYRNMKITEKLYGQLQNSSGQIKPETLYNAAKPNVSNIAYGGGGVLGDLARSGRQLKPTIPDSGTASQLIGAGALGGAGVGAFIDPTIAAGALGTIGLSKGLNSAMTSNYAREGMSPAIQAGAQALENSGVIPSVVRATQNQFNSGQQKPAYEPSNDPELRALIGGYNPKQDAELQKLLRGQ